MGRRTLDLTGQRFGRLTALTRDYSGPGGHARWLCKCDCGTVKPVNSNALRSGATQSCGCLKSELVTSRSTTHGLAPRQGKPRAYNSWSNMVRRCTKGDDPRYPDWGGRGITIESRWMNFANFLGDMGERPLGMSLERKDNDGPYAHWNCVWATPAEQRRNTRETRGKEAR